MGKLPIKYLSFLLLAAVISACATPNYTAQEAPKPQNGQGTHNYANGDKYVGDWVDGQRHGQGVLTYATGNEYVGGWKYDKRHGQGILHVVDDHVFNYAYDGEWMEHKKSGYGTLTYADGDKYVGEFKDGSGHGQGTFIYANGDKWVGELSYDKRHGQGTHTYANGDTYVGKYKDGLRHGEGTFTYANGSVLVGIWERDTFPVAKNTKPKTSDQKPKVATNTDDDAIDLTVGANQLAAEYEDFLPSPKPKTPTIEPEQVNAGKPPSLPRGGGFGEFNLSRVAFDNGNLSGSAFLWGVTFGGTVYSHYEIAFSFNEIAPLLSPDLDSQAELGSTEFLDINMRMLSLRRNWQINDTTTVFVVAGYSKIRIEIDHLSLCIFCGFTVNSANTYRSKLTGAAWGVGMQWKTNNNGYRSLKYMDHSESGFGFKGLHLNFRMPFP